MQIKITKFNKYIIIAINNYWILIDKIPAKIYNFLAFIFKEINNNIWDKLFEILLIKIKYIIPNKL